MHFHVRKNIYSPQRQEMYLDRYEFKISERLSDYEFISEGPQGRIKKVARFSFLASNLYNLTFGDFDQNTGKLNDKTVTNNGDRDKVLTTVALIVYDFIALYPNARVIAKGSTGSRTRLYRMAIANHWKTIQLEFEVYGLISKKWEVFKFNKNYDAFLIQRR